MKGQEPRCGVAATTATGAPASVYAAAIVTCAAILSVIAWAAAFHPACRTPRHCDDGQYVDGNARGVQGSGEVDVGHPAAPCLRLPCVHDARQQSYSEPSRLLSLGCGWRRFPA